MEGVTTSEQGNNNLNNGMKVMKESGHSMVSVIYMNTEPRAIWYSFG